MFSFSKLRQFLLLIISFTLVSCGPNSSSEKQIRATVKLEDIGIIYANVDTPEAQAWGPQGLFAIRDGYIIPDNVSGKLVVMDNDFHTLRHIDVSTYTQGVTSLTQDNENLVILDSFSHQPRLTQLGQKDNILNTHEVPLINSLAPTGVKKDDSGIILEYGHGEVLYHVTQSNQSLGLIPVNQYSWNGKSYSVDEPTSTFSHERTVHIGKNTGLIKVPNHLGLAQILGPDNTGGIFVLVEDVVIYPMVEVEQSVWHFASSGDIISVMKVPLDEQFIKITNSVTLGHAKEPIALVTKRNELQIKNLVNTIHTTVIGRKSNQLPKEAEIANGIGQSRQGLITVGTSNSCSYGSCKCLTPDEMVRNAQEYYATTAYISTASINNDTACSRTKPTYLGSAGTYGSVSYDWGGWDTPAEFKVAMAANRKAGNSRNYGALQCSYGVDCSGFVTRVWGFTDFKRSTVTIPSWSKSYTPVLTRGDVLNKYNDHVVMFMSNITNGVVVYEARGNPYGRVVYNNRMWSDLSGYVAYRSQTSCLQ